MAETTARNLRLIRDKRSEGGDNVDYIREIESALEEAVVKSKRAKLAPKWRKTPPWHTGHAHSAALHPPPAHNG